MGGLSNGPIPDNTRTLTPQTGVVVKQSSFKVTTKRLGVLRMTHPSFAMRGNDDDGWHVQWSVDLINIPSVLVAKNVQTRLVSI